MPANTPVPIRIIIKLKRTNKYRNNHLNKKVGFIIYVTVYHMCQFLGSVAKSHARNYFTSSSHVLLKWSTKGCHVK